MKIVHPKEPPLIYGFMNYHCERCNETFTMNLEVGVEDWGKHGRQHQPCPFVIRHDKCGWLSAHDCSGVIEYSTGPFKAKPGTRYFAYDNSAKKDACGEPSIYGYKAEEEEEG